MSETCWTCKHYKDDWGRRKNGSGYGFCTKHYPHTRTNDGKGCGEYLHFERIEPRDARIAELEAALRPFAHAHQAAQSAFEGKFPDVSDLAAVSLRRIEWTDLHNARAALQGKGGGS